MRNIIRKLLIATCIMVALLYQNALANNHIVAIDAGGTSCSFDESIEIPLGPGATETAKAYSANHTCPNTGVRGPTITLGVAKELEKILEERGYTVIMTRDSEDDLVSYVERGIISSDADICISMHCRKRQDISTGGAMIYIQTDENPYVGYLYDESFELSNYILDFYCANTEFDYSGFYHTDTDKALNWSTVPTAMLMLGCVMDEKDEAILSESDNWYAMAVGIADGVDSYFLNKYEKMSDVYSEALFSLDEARDMLYDYLWETWFAFVSENASDWGEIDGSACVDGDDYCISYRSYTGAIGTYYINMYSGDVYESWLPPFDIGEETPQEFLVNLLEWQEETQSSYMDVNYNDYQNLNLSIQEADGPHEGEYDEIIASGEEFYLCKKIEAGFSEKSTLYGIYNSEKQSWDVEYQEVPGFDQKEKASISYLGEGVFYCSYTGYGVDNATFISAPLGGCFILDRKFETKGFFVNGILAGILEDGYYNDVILLDTYGNQQELFDGDDVPQIRYQNQYGIIADSYNGSEHVTYAYWYDGGNVLELPREYIKRMYTIQNDNQRAFYDMTNDVVSFYNMLGDDDNYYYAELDKAGNEIQSPTLYKP